MPPNILLFMTDSMDGRVMRHLGHPGAHTPNMDRLAARGTSFANAYCNSPQCAPSRASFWSGQYVHRVQAWNNPGGLPLHAPTFGTHLEDAGYGLHVFGKTRLPRRAATPSKPASPPGCAPPTSNAPTTPAPRPPPTTPPPPTPQLFTLSKGRGRFGRPRPKPVRGLPRNPRPTHLDPSRRHQLFTLSEGRGRFRRLRRKPVRGLPRTQPQQQQPPPKRHQLFTLSKGRGRCRRPRRQSVRGLPSNQPPYRPQHQKKLNTYPPTKPQPASTKKTGNKSTTPANSSPTTQQKTRPTSSTPAPTSPIPPFRATQHWLDKIDPAHVTPPAPTNPTSTPSWTT